MRNALIPVLAAAMAVVSAVAVAAPSLNQPAQATVAPAKAIEAPAAKPAAVPAPAAKTLLPLPARVAQPHPCPKAHPAMARMPMNREPKVADGKLPRPAALRPRTVDLAPLTGKGMWWTTWQDSKLDAAGMVRRARSAGLHQIWVRTGGTKQGWYGTGLLTAVLPVAHAAGIAVVAWDFAALSDPAADAARAAKALTGTFGGQHVDAFSPDIETPDEGTFDTARRVRLYLSLVRVAAGNTPVVATVMNPTRGQLDSYPYAAEAPYVDAFAPMVYWSCTEPGAAAKAAVKALSKLRPVHLIGQAYDMIEDGGRRGMPTAAEEWRFLDVAKAGGAIGASLYDGYSATRQEWTALGAYPWARPN